MKFIILMISVSIFFIPKAESGKMNSEVSFAFKEDRKVITGEINYSAIKSSDALKKDSFLQAPMTHLEYVVDRFDRQLNKEQNINYILKKFGNFFKKNRHHGKSFDLEINGSAIFDSDSGKILLMYDVENAGSSTIPLKELCQKLLDEIGYSISGISPLKPLVYDYKLVSKLEEKIKANVSYLVSIHTSSDEYKIHHYMSCLLPSTSEEVIFNKSSSDLRNKKSSEDNK